MNIEDLLKNLPHRYPFLLVDKVIYLDKDKEIVAIKNVTINEHFFQGHFPCYPVMPGVLIVEALAQTAGILANKTTKWPLKDSLFFLGSISNARFKKVVIPGDQLKLTAKTLKRRSNIWKFSCTALVDSEVVCTTEITCMEGTS